MGASVITVGPWCNRGVVAFVCVCFVLFFLRKQLYQSYKHGCEPWIAGGGEFGTLNDCMK